MTQCLLPIEPLEQRIAPAFAAVFELFSLDGLNGFRLSGAAAGDQAGYSASDAGDVNGDGFGDLIIGAKGANGNTRSGASYVVFGRASAFAPDQNLSTLDGSNGFRLSGIRDDLSGGSVSAAGDVNGDGFDDVIIGAFSDPSATGASYLVFGKGSGFAANLNLSSLDGINGFRLTGVAAGDLSGSSVSAAGDVNGDGFDDVIIGAFGADPNGPASGASYLVFGKGSGFAANLNLSSLDGSNGFKIAGVTGDDRSGRSVSAAGDVNGDGFDDLIVGASHADSNGRLDSGASYVVFGKQNGFAASLNLSTLNGSNGFTVSGAALANRSGDSVSGAGDVNGDGFDDVIIGAFAAQADPSGPRSGASYVVFGKATSFAADLNLSSLDGSNGFKLSGIAAYDYCGSSVSTAGDINGDGFDDLIIGAERADPNGYSSGSSYVVFGKPTGFARNLNLSALDGTNGFQLHGVARFHRSGSAVSAAGDINGDGFHDVIIGAFGFPTQDNFGASYVIFGRGVELTVSDAEVLEGEGGTATLRFSVNLSEPASIPVTVKVASLDGDALAGSDFAGLVATTLSFAPGETNKTVNVDVLGDTAFEADEAFSIVLSDATGGVIRDGTALGTIRNNDAPPVVSTAGGGSVSEGNAGTRKLTFTLSLSEASELPASVTFSSADGTAIAESDYTALTPDTLTFAPGETNKTITVEVLGDPTIEDHESFSVILSEVAGATIGIGTAIGTILNDDTALRIIPPVSDREGDFGTTPFVFGVNLEKPSTLPVTVRYATADGTANAGSDYEAASERQITFAPGETTKSITIGVTGDTEAEAHETFSVILSAANGALIAEGTATGTILNDDTLVRVTDASLLEGHSGTRTMLFTVSLTVATALPVSVNFTSADDTATSGTDYAALTPGTLEFAPGETSKTLTIDVLGDTAVEATQTLTVVLSDASNAVLDDGAGLGTILDDDVTPAGTRKATFTDVDGELVTIRVNKGALKVEDFTIFPSGLGAQLALIDLSGEREFAGANLSITAKAPRGVAPGDRLAHVGYINATGIDLGKVLVKGILGQIDAGDDLTPAPGLLSLSVQSIGRSGLLTQLPGGSLQSDIAGGLKSLKLADGLHDATFSVSGDIGAIKIAGDVLGGSIRGDGKIGAITITGDLAASASGSATISARGDSAATTAGKALAIRSISIGGSVDHAQILAGYDRSGAAVNGDASIGGVTVRRDWMASNLVAGARAGADSLFGTDDDALISNATPLVARIASILVKGTASGSTNPAENFGFVSQQIDAFQSGGAKLPLTTGPSSDLAGLPVGSTGNLRVREVG